MIDYTLIITSCNRFDLLQITMQSFFDYCDILPMKVVICDDSCKTIPYYINTYHHNTINLYTNCQGQAAAIDACMAKVDTTYYFHCEDDWEFYRTGFIKESYEALKDPSIINHWLRERNDTNGHPIIGNEVLLNHGVWHGFTFNPTLKRLSDYKSFGSLTKLGKRKGFEVEIALNKFYKQKGYHATIAEHGYVKHIGEGRHIEHDLEPKHS